MLTYTAKLHQLSPRLERSVKILEGKMKRLVLLSFGFTIAFSIFLMGFAALIPHSVGRRVAPEPTALLLTTPLGGTGMIVFGVMLAKHIRDIFKE